MGSGSHVAIYEWYDNVFGVIFVFLRLTGQPHMETAEWRNEVFGGASGSSS